MLEFDAENDWWDTMPDVVKEDIEAAISESENGQVIAHEDVQKRYQQFLA